MGLEVSKHRLTLFLLAIAILLFFSFAAMRPMNYPQHTPMPSRPHRTFSTRFPKDEFPISEAGNWIGGHTVGLDWSDMGTVSGHTFGIVRAPGYDDPTALLTGTWEPDQMAQGVVFSMNQQDTPNQEVELRLRSALTGHVCTGYEIYWRVSPNKVAYQAIARWNGRLGDFTTLVINYGAKYGVSHGDVIKAIAKEDVISAFKNGVLQAQVKDSTFRTGSPGMGTDWGPGTNTNFGLSQFMATDDLTDSTNSN
jgi:hypothetical protein